MATYNGEKHLLPQLESILAELGPDDELVIVDDTSTDDTVARIREVSDPRIRLIINEHNLGHVRTFETALRRAQGQTVSFSDQDDIWPAGRTERLLALLEHHLVACGRFETFADEPPPQPTNVSTWASRPIVDGIQFELGRRPYFASTMAVHASLVPVLLPFPANVEAHDHWLALAGLMNGGVAFSDQIVTFRRLHESNLTPERRRALGKVVATRGLHLRHVATLARRRWAPPPS